MTVEELRNRFPQLKEKVYGKQLVYLDNAATSLRPDSVIDSWTKSASKNNSNLHRAVHNKAEVATIAFESARDCVREFLGAGSREEIIFTSGATNSINLVAFSFGEAFVREGDEILVDEESHHSNILPWQLLSERKKAVLKHFKLSEFNPQRDLGDRTRIVAVSHISNVLGIVNNIREIISAAHSRGIPVLVDGAQGIVHEMVDVKSLDCDFYAFSGHKMYAAPGTGVLYGKKEWLEKMPPFMSGGEMIGTVRWEGSTFAPLPHKFEAGTQNISGVPTFVEAISIMRQMHSEEIENETFKLKQYLMDRLPRINGLRLFGYTDDLDRKAPVFSFAIEGVHHEDIALILDKMGIAVRSGQMCAEPLMDREGVTGMVRASFAPYNTFWEAEFFVESLERAIKMLV